MMHIQTSHVTHPNEACHPYEKVMSHTQMSHFPPEERQTHGSCHTQISHFPHEERQTHGSCHTQTSHATRTDEPCHTRGEGRPMSPGPGIAALPQRIPLCAYAKGVTPGASRMRMLSALSPAACTMLVMKPSTFCV